MEKEIELHVQGSVYEPVINALKTLKVIDLIAAVALAAEVGEFGTKGIRLRSATS